MTKATGTPSSSSDDEDESDEGDHARVASRRPLRARDAAGYRE